jgi:hypothetical protein
MEPQTHVRRSHVATKRGEQRRNCSAWTATTTLSLALTTLPITGRGQSFSLLHSGVRLPRIAVGSGVRLDRFRGGGEGAQDVGRERQRSGAGVFDRLGLVAAARDGGRDTGLSQEPGECNVPHGLADRVADLANPRQGLEDQRLAPGLAMAAMGPVSGEEPGSGAGLRHFGGGAELAGQETLRERAVAEDADPSLDAQRLDRALDRAPQEAVGELVGGDRRCGWRAERGLPTRVIARANSLSPPRERARVRGASAWGRDIALTPTLSRRGRGS